MSKPEKWDGWDRAAMERMSTAGLEELLRQDFRAPEGGTADMSGLYRAAQVLAEREQSPAAEADRAWEVFWEKYRPFARKGCPHCEGAPPPSDAACRRRHTHSRRLWVVLAAAVLAALLLSAAAAGGRE